MLIDSNTVFYDEAPMTSGESVAVGLTSFLQPGRVEPVPIRIRVTRADAGITALDIQLQQADAEGGPFEDVPNACLALEPADLTEGADIGWRWLPANTLRPWLRLKIQVTGGDGSGRLFAAVLREDPLDMRPGMYIDKGVARG